MSSLPEYNGWTNKPTWMVNLYFEPSNDEYLIEQAVEILQDADQDLIDNFEQQAPKYILSDSMKDYFEEMLYGEGTSDQPDFWDELVIWAFAYINWDELAEHVIEQAKYEMEEL